MSILRLMLCAVVVGTGVARGAPEIPALTPEAQDLVAAYLRDPAGNAKTFLDAARQQGGAVNPIQALLLGDAAIRAGRYRTASEFFMAVQEGGLASSAELGMAWASLGRGQLTEAYDHLGAAGSLSPELRQLTDYAMAMVAVANGSPDGRTALAAAEAQENVDPALREVAPLLDAYARYWSGDAAGAADAFTAFAVANPDSRFTDDAVYAAAQAKLRAGREDEAQADLEALAGDQPVQGRLSSRLVALDGRALLREGMRRDRTRATRLLPRRLADLLDGDGMRLAQAALAGRGAHDESDAPAADGARVAGAREGGRWLTHHQERASGGAPAHPAAAAPGAGSPLAPASGGAPAQGTRFPWSVLFSLGALIIVLALWLLARGGRPDQARSR
jgi:tetratricopeptide (TPR) repeat protein